MLTRFHERFPIFSYYLFFLYFSLVPQLLVALSAYSGSIGLRDAALMSTLWLLPIIAFPGLARIISAVLGVILCLSSLGSVGYWLIYGQEFSQSVFFIAMDSNPREAGEFISSYLRWYYPLVFLAYMTPPFIYWRALKNLDHSVKKRVIAAIIVTIIVFFPLVKETTLYGPEAGIRHLANRLEPTMPWNTVIGFIKYQEQLSNMKGILSKMDSIPLLENLTETNADQPKTLVFVISESQNRQRMSLYGYPRQTTPLLDAVAAESDSSMFVFGDVIAPRPYTIEALQQVLSFADSKNMSKFYSKPSLLMMMKQAGYHITWITNQQTQTERNTMLTMFSQLADDQVYLNNQRRQNAEQHDEVVLEPFNKALADHQDKKRLIVVHLLGTHRKYDYRYPDEFQIFNDRDDKVPTWVPDENIEEYNSYDNAVSYNDMVVSSILKSFQTVQTSAAMLFFSDHGEDVYDTPKALFSGRNEMAPTPPMYTVPFLLWVNNEYKAQRDTSQWGGYTDRAYSTADAIFTMADLAGLSFEGMDNSRSIISSQFTPHPRWIGMPEQPKTVQDYNDFIKTYRADK